MGDHSGDVSRSYAIGNVSGQDYVGVLTGTQGTDQINDSFALGTVRGNDYVGGLTGLFRPAIRSREVGRRDYEWRCSDGTYSNLDHQVGDGQPCPPTHLDSARLGHRPDRLRDRARGDTGYPHLRKLCHWLGVGPSRQQRVTLTQLRALDPGLRLLRLSAVDTLRLNPLAIPRYSYHDLVKHYQG